MDYEKIALYSVVTSAILFALVVIWGFNTFLSPAILSAQHVRNEEIAVAQQKRDEAIRQANVLREEQAKFAASLAQSRTAAETEAERERDRILMEAHTEGERIVQHANGELARARTAAQVAMQTQLIHLALKKAQKRAECEVNADIDRTITNHFLDQIAQSDRALAEVNGG